MRRTLAGLVLFSVSFGYVEAAVVAYLRSLYAPMRARLHPELPRDELFPLLSLEQLQSAGPEHLLRVKTELGREFATLLMLAGVALTMARNLREWTAAFLVCFGFWDTAFYLFLKLLLGWPASLLTWDILFLLPVPWVGPVLAPVLVSLSMIVAGTIVLWREHLRKPLLLHAKDWLLIIGGGVIVFTAFIWDFRNTARGRAPNPFNWPLFATGELTGLGGFISGWVRRPSRARLN